MTTTNLADQAADPHRHRGDEPGGSMSLNWTPLRHKMLAAVARSEVAAFHDVWEWGSRDVCMFRTEAASLTGLEGGGLIEREAPDQLPNWRVVKPTASGHDRLAEWSAQHGEPPS